MFNSSEDESGMLGFGFLGVGICSITNLPVLRYYDMDEVDGPEVICLEMQGNGRCPFINKVCRRFWFLANDVMSKENLAQLPVKARNRMPDRSGDFCHRRFVGRGICGVVRQECLSYVDEEDSTGLWTYCDNYVENEKEGGCQVCGICMRGYQPDGPISFVFREN